MRPAPLGALAARRAAGLRRWRQLASSAKGLRAPVPLWVSSLERAAVTHRSRFAVELAAAEGSGGHRARALASPPYRVRCAMLPAPAGQSCRPSQSVSELSAAGAAVSWPLDSAGAAVRCSVRQIQLLPSQQPVSTEAHFVSDSVQAIANKATLPRVVIRHKACISPTTTTATLFRLYWQNLFITSLDLMDTKLLFAPKKGKEPTKAAKAIDKENAATLRFYLIMASVAIVAKFFLRPRLSSLSFAIIVQAASLYGLHYTAKTGTDLSVKGSFAERIKDVVITTAACCFLSIFSELLWLVWLWLPAHLVYSIWTNVIAPWIFQPAPEEAPEVAEKKRRKMERKMARAGHGR